jgi:hypothetical protein
MFILFLQHNLPPLNDVSDLRKLTASQSRSYYQGYYPDTAGADNEAEQLFAIGQAIECLVRDLYE